ncbi:MAG: fatty-acid oxidation protein subunit alpha [Dolichospermum sp. JUN01]|nr:fatty-acid oxidation protein subunit alpha [Dolichospermum sp. JUN01]MBS9392683.1 XisH family protein [Dolichospermum sp. OL01]MCO5796321.1 XisH family protein [Dolichospermum sp. OL03]MCS6281118.1 XisH family protein [Dolichospermum sp.]QSV57939.1 MAG: fatty-acid oxidation protein subunit alpha [Dolichospermum sp. LBC05a]
MSRKDIFHDLVKDALTQDGWTISHDPLYLSIGNLNIQIDLGAECLIGAEKDRQKIAVEVKSFLRASKITDFYGALGQYLSYKIALEENEPDRILYLAVPDSTYQSLFGEVLIQKVLQNYPVKLVVYDEVTEVIKLWID